MKKASEKIIESILTGTQFVRCEGCNQIVNKDEITPEKLCADCYVSYTHDMEWVWGEREQAYK